MARTRSDVRPGEGITGPVPGGPAPHPAGGLRCVACVELDSANTRSGVTVTVSAVHPRRHEGGRPAGRRARQMLFGIGSTFVEAGPSSRGRND